MTHLGVDLGFGANKIFGAHGGLELPSQVAVANRRTLHRTEAIKSKRPPLKVEIGNHAYYVGLGAHDWGRPVESLDYERLTGSPEIQAIFYGAITDYIAAYGDIGQLVTLYVGLPVETLSGSKAAVKRTTTSVRDWMVGAHEWTANGRDYSFVVDNVAIATQPTGALMDYLMDDDGSYIPQRKQEIKGEIGIISVGFNTVELLAIRDMAPVQRFTGGTTSGVRRLLELVNGAGHYSLGELDAMLRSGSLDVRGELPLWAREVDAAVEKTWSGNWRRFARIVAVGGGSALLNGHLTGRFEGKAHMPDDPVISIARGLYKMGLRR